VRRALLLVSYQVAINSASGEHLDYEHHDMSEKHEPAGAAMYPAILHLAGDMASDRAEHAQSFHKNIHSVNVFVNKKKAYQAAAGESGHDRAQTPRLPTHRVSPVSQQRKRKQRTQRQHIPLHYRCVRCVLGDYGDKPG
jgi:hypothetical protein